MLIVYNILMKYCKGSAVTKNEKKNAITIQEPVFKNLPDKRQQKCWMKSGTRYVVIVRACALRTFLRAVLF